MGLTLRQRNEHIPIATVPQLTLHNGIDHEKVDAGKIAADWLGKLESVFDQKSFGDLSELFLDDCWWRDWVGLTWDLRTVHGEPAISKYLKEAPHTLTALKIVPPGALQPALMDMGGMAFIQFGFNFSTPHGDGTGIVKLANTSSSEWKAWIVFTSLDRLNHQKESIPTETRNENAQANGVGSEEIDVLVVGAGHSGLEVSVHLKAMGINTLIVERHDRVGDTWRNRYKALKIHSTREVDHYPFLPFPGDRPKHLTGEANADWMEHYVKTLQLNILLSTEVTSVKYLKEPRRYRVETRTLEGTRTWFPKHVVGATGFYSTEPNLPTIPGQESFKGQLYHSKAHTSVSETSDIHNKKIVIVGTGPSAHGIAEEFVLHGAKQVTMIQRSPIFSLSIGTLEKVMFPLWYTHGISTEEADLIANSFPTAVSRALNIPVTEAMYEVDKEDISGLRKAGVQLHNQPLDFGFLDGLVAQRSAYYIAVGANEMIIDGRIKIHHSEDGIREINPKGLTLATGVDVEADTIIFATGFKHPDVEVAKLLGEDVVAKMKNFSFLDSEQERVGISRPTGLPGFWFINGNFTVSRQLSLPLALQIAGVVKGYNTGYYESQTLYD